MDDPDKQDGKAAPEWLPPDITADVDKLAASFRQHFREAKPNLPYAPDDPLVVRLVRQFDDQYRLLDPKLGSGAFLLAAMQRLQQLQPSLGVLADASVPVHEPEVVVFADTAAAVDELAVTEELALRDLFIQVVMWLLTILTVAKLALDAHHDGQSAADSMLSNAPGWGALALAITWRLQDKRKGK